jgi:hypothetical protein
MKQKRKTSSKVEGKKPVVATSSGPAVPAPEAFLAEARQEPKRVLLIDHMDTIKVLREEKKFSFRSIAAWLSERGIETDHSSVYRVYLLSIPKDKRDPNDDWSDVDASVVEQ